MPLINILFSIIQCTVLNDSLNDRLQSSLTLESGDENYIFDKNGLLSTFLFKLFVVDLSVTIMF